MIALIIAGGLIHLTRKHGERLQEEADRAYPDDKPQSAAA